VEGEVPAAETVVTTVQRNGRSALEVAMQRSAFMTGVLITATLALMTTGWVVTSSGQAVRPVPGPGSGVVTVEGTVNVGNTPTVIVGNTPTVNATQNGNWRVTLANTTPEFVQSKRSYSVEWPDRRVETIEVAEIGSNGWVRVDAPRRRWVNLSQALAVEEATVTAR
jgi:hypothetical protein